MDHFCTGTWDLNSYSIVTEYKSDDFRSINPSLEPIILMENIVIQVRVHMMAYYRYYVLVSLQKMQQNVLSLSLLLKEGLQSLLGLSFHLLKVQRSNVCTYIIALFFLLRRISNYRTGTKS